MRPLATGLRIAATTSPSGSLMFPPRDLRPCENFTAILIATRDRADEIRKIVQELPEELP